MRVIKRRVFALSFSLLLAAPLAAVVVVAAAVSVTAEQLPVKTYTTADGLARDTVNHIIQDSRGFLWFATDEGLSRFDGYRFTNYGPEQGLPGRVNALIETRAGVFWIATGNGLYRFNPMGVAAPLASSNADRNQGPATKGLGSTPEPMFIAYYLGESKDERHANVLLEDHAGVVWCGTYRGLHRLEQKNGDWNISRVEIGLPGETLFADSLTSLVEGSDGSLWIGAMSGLYRLRPSGRPERYTKQEGLPDNHITSLLKDKSGQLWVGTLLGLCRIVADPQPNKQIVARVLTDKDGLLKQGVFELFQTSDGKLLASSNGLCELDLAAQPEAQRFHCYARAQGMTDAAHAFAEDAEGNIWLGTSSEGVMKLERSGLITYREADGLSGLRIGALFENRAGELCVAIGGNQKLPINCFDGKRFNAFGVELPQGVAHTWGWNQITFQDSLGDWWIPSSNGLFRYASDPATGRPLRKPKAVYTPADGLTATDIFRLYEDSHGDIWIATITLNHDVLNRWERATNTIHAYTHAADGVPFPSPTAFREDRAGNIWIGFYNGGLARFRNGRFDLYPAHDGMLEGLVQALTLDSAGRLWVATSQSGLYRVDDPTTEHPRFDALTTANGLSSNQVTSITEDRWGRLYIGSGRGVDQLDPATGHIRHFTIADGLPDNYINVSFMDHEGALWFGTLNGLARLIPQPERQPSAPPIMLSGLRISGLPHRLSELGVTEVAKLDLNSDQNQLQIDFFSIGFGAGETLRYQYMLEGADKDWSAPSAERTVSYARLAPGAYRFLVRAVNAGGVVSRLPASVQFTIWPPFWRRWWFIALSVLIFSGIVYSVFRYRLARAIELERVRTRIATDLHDDIGASLSQIAILSEVIGQRIGKEDSPVRQPLSMIAGTSREMVDAMSDIVWAINPQRDHLSDLSHRMRRFASDIISARDIRFRFHAPDAERDVRLGTDIRREVYLIFKETVNNMVKHSDCTAAELSFQIAGNWLTLIVSDNGKGFDVDAAHNGNHSGMGGHGLGSMRKRAEALGGTYEIASRKGKGTTVTLRVPLSGRRRKRMVPWKRLLPK